ncbi:MAG: HAMP domain-containing sensor histidine kinase [Planctomycetia bacterium]|nr:HAMP domain-containing sensor histidine kinase [Planctomycetia bacterium]
MRQAEENLRMMYDITIAISQTVDIDELLRRILDLIFDWVSPDRSCILLIDEKTKEFVPKAQRSRRSRHRGMTISQTILEYVREKREGVLTSDALEDLRFDSAESIVSQGVREAICVPMQGRYDVVGAIYIDTTRSLRQLTEEPDAVRFTENHLRLMAAIANQAALAVEDTRYYASAIAAEHLAAVGQTIATISHHIKNILQGISGGSYLVDQGLEKSDLAMVRGGWGIVTRNQSRISTLVLDMLTLSKEREPDPRPTDLNALCGEIVELMRQYAKENEVELTYSPGAEIPIFCFDPDSLHKAILNLVTNGIDATAPKNRPSGQDDEESEMVIPETPQSPGHLRVTTEYLKDEGTLHVLVDDDGPGIPADQIPSLFRPFTSTKRNRGTGLGLPVSEKIMREHGGRILVDSVVGRGTRFTLEWPAVSVSHENEEGENGVKEWEIRDPGEIGR